MKAAKCLKGARLNTKVIKKTKLRRISKNLQTATSLLASSLERQQEREALEERVRTRKGLVQAAINEVIDRKNDFLQEQGATHSGLRVPHQFHRTRHEFRRGPKPLRNEKNAEVQRKIKNLK